MKENLLKVLLGYPIHLFLLFLLILGYATGILNIETTLSMLVGMIVGSMLWYIFLRDKIHKEERNGR